MSTATSASGPRGTTTTWGRAPAVGRPTLVAGGRCGRAAVVAGDYSRAQATAAPVRRWWRAWASNPALDHLYLRAPPPVAGHAGGAGAHAPSSPGSLLLAPACPTRAVGGCPRNDGVPSQAAAAPTTTLDRPPRARCLFFTARKNRTITTERTHYILHTRLGLSSLTLVSHWPLWRDEKTHSSFRVQPAVKPTLWQGSGAWPGDLRETPSGTAQA